MDQHGDNIPTPESPFSFQRLLCGDDWQRWDTFPTVDANANSPDPTVEMNHDGPTIESDPRLMTFTMEEVFEQWLWLQSLTNQQFETSSLSQEEEDMGYSHEETFTYEELLEITENVGDVCTGLNIEIIDETLSRRKYEDCCGEREKCVICLYELEYNEEASKLGCGHDFHFDCIKRWLMVKNMCPLCKQEVV